MAKKSEPSRLKTWLIVLMALLDDIAALALVIIVLWIFDVKLATPVLIVLVLVTGAVLFLIHRAVVPSLRRKKINGAEGMIGLAGKVTEPLKPNGTVKINGEYWKGISIKGDCEIDA